MKNLPFKNSWSLVIVALTASMILGASAQTPPPVTSSPLPAPTAHGPTFPLIQEWKALGDSVPSLEIVSYDGIPLVDVVNHLREEFRKRKSDFDVLLPKEAVLPTTSINVQSASVSLSLRNVNPTEIFNAMNLYFDIEKLPLRWELTVNGRRPTAVLHLLAEKGAQAGDQSIEPMVVWVGDMIGDPKHPKMSIDEIARTLLQTYALAYPGNGDSLIQVHKEAELIVVRGTSSQSRFVVNALTALKLRASKAWLRAPPSIPESSPSASPKEKAR